MSTKILSSPIPARVVPFAAFALLTLPQGHLGDHSQYWVYAAKTGIGAWLIWLVRPYVSEMRWRLSGDAVLVGVFVFLIWISLGYYYPMMERSGTFNPNIDYGTGSFPAIIFIWIRILGSSLIVPPLEEVFYRSFLYRYFQKADFLKLPLSRFEWKAFLVIGIVFGVTHFEWLPGILSAFAFQGLVCRKNRLGDAIVAHAIANFLLGLWIVIVGDYIFW